MSVRELIANFVSPWWRMEQMIVLPRNEGANVLTKEILDEVYDLVSDLNSIVVAYNGVPVCMFSSCSLCFPFD